MGRIIHLHRPDEAGPRATYAVAVDRYLVGAGISAGSARVYRIALTTWAWLLAGEQPPPGKARRGATPPTVDLAVLDNPATPRRSLRRSLRGLPPGPTPTPPTGN